jgi:anti-anti-sigma factor
MTLPARPALEVHAADRGDTYVLTPVGELDLASTTELMRELATARRSSAQVIVVDLGHLSFIDSSGLQALVSACAALKARLVLTNPTRAVRRAFELAGLLRLITDGDLPGRVSPAASTRKNQATLAAALRELRRRPAAGR